MMGKRSSSTHNIFSAALMATDARTATWTNLPMTNLEHQRGKVIRHCRPEASREYGRHLKMEHREICNEKTRGSKTRMGILCKYETGKKAEDNVSLW